MDELQVFGVLFSETTYFVVVTNPDPKNPEFAVAVGATALLKLLVSLEPRPLKVRQWAHLFNVPEFLAFAKEHVVLKHVKTWDAVFGKLQ